MYRLHSLKEAQSRRCPVCHLHGLLNAQALHDEQDTLHRVILTSKLVEGLLVYYKWLDHEVDLNETKSIIKIVYTVGLIISAAGSVWVFDSFMKKSAAKKKVQEAKLATKIAMNDEDFDQRLADKQMLRELQEMLNQTKDDPQREKID